MLSPMDHMIFRHSLLVFKQKITLIYFIYFKKRVHKTYKKIFKLDVAREQLNIGQLKHFLGQK